MIKQDDMQEKIERMRLQIDELTPIREDTYIRKDYLTKTEILHTVLGTDLTRVSQLTLLHPGQSEPRCHDTISSFFFFWRLAHSGPLLWLSKGSHAQRIPLNMGALHCVTGGHIRGYKAHTPGGVKDTLHPL